MATAETATSTTIDPAPRAASGRVTTRAATKLVRVPRRSPEAEERRKRQRDWVERGLAVAIPGVLIGLWELASRSNSIDPRVYPAPSTIFEAIWQLHRSGRLWRDVWATLSQVLKGFVIGSLVGFAVGMFMGLSRTLRRALEPMLNALYVVPKLALLPLLLAVFGLGDAPKTALVSITVFFFVWIQTMESFSTIPAGYMETAQSLNVSRRQLFLHVLLPAALPQILVGLRVAMGIAILVIVAVEFVIGNEGLGRLIYSSRELFVMDNAYAGIIVVAILGVILTGILTLVSRWVTPWTWKVNK
jgi:sulfonate transport system permease protein